MSGQIYDEIGDHANALKYYKALYEIDPKTFRDIPEEYLKDISDKDYQTVLKEKKKAKEEREKAIKKELEQQSKEKKQPEHKKA